MAMVVQHNLTAMNSNRMLGVTTNMKSKSTEKLSSGYKINRAADDASGLAISEKMRKQIRGLTQASSNAQDGISAVQTAEGALAEVHDMLQRMNELAVKSANGTNSASDRSAIQSEIDQLTTEIDRVAETTKFNETYLLKGDRDAVKGYSYNYSTVEADKAVVGTVKMTTDTATGLKATFTFADTKTANATEASAAQVNEVINALKTSGLNISATLSTDKRDSANPGDQELVYKVSLGGAVADKYTVVASSSGPDKRTGEQSFYIKDNAGTTIATIQISGAVAGESKADGVYSANLVAQKATAAYKAGESYAFFDRDGNKIAANDLNNYFSSETQGTGKTAETVDSARTDAPAVYDAVGNKIKITQMAGQVASTQDITGKLQVGLHVGADATRNNQITMNIESMSAKSLGVVGLKVDGTDDSNALNAIDTIKAAISKVSAQRSDLGAVQNRLEHTIKNLDNVVENTTAAESQIRDTDMASEMVNYSKNNILSQAGQSMLAQANQSNQGVLSLLG